MRLCDLDALKEDLKKYFSDGTLDSVSAKLAFNMILRKIDNAPTVAVNCKDCDGYEAGYSAGLKYAERPKGDLISREDLKEHKFVGNKFVQIGGRTNGKTLESINKAYQQGWNDCIDAIIDNAPTVTPQSGHWVEEKINAGSRKVFCSECGCPPPFEYVNTGDVYSASGYGVINKTKFCPNCGALMKGGAE